MYTILCVLNSDRMNRYGMLFSLGSLAAALEQRWATGIPNYVGHDHHRLIGWSHPLGVHLQAGLARLTGVSLLSETADEQAALASRARGYIQARTDERVGPHVKELQDRLGDRLTPAHGWIDAGCAAVVDPGLAVRVFPDIFGLRDKDGLVSLARLNRIAPGVFECDGLLFFAHPYFRRSLSRHNTLNDAFLARFSELPGPLNPRIALDEDLVGLASTLALPIELEYWWGPKFDNDLSQIQEGITRHQATDAERALHGFSWTEFWWYGQGGQHTFEAEEVVNLPSGGIGETTFGCRFVHSILDDDARTPIHLDGAIRQYDEEAMLARLDCNIYQAGRKADYQKLWRVDGGLPVETWKELLCHYFRDNHLVGEYLGAARPDDEEKASVIPTSSEPLEPFVPYNLRPGDGVQVHVSFHDKSGDEPGRSVRVLDALTGDGHELRFIDADTTELSKILSRAGESLSIPPGTNRVKFGDTVRNLPLVAHIGPDALKLAERTLAAVAELCEGLARDEDHLLSFTLAVEYADREVWFSWAGHLVDIRAWFRAGSFGLPRNVEEVPSWLEAGYTRLNGLFPGGHSTGIMHRLLQASGMLVFVRRFLMPETFTFKWDEQQQAVIVEVRVPKDSPEWEMLQTGELQVAAALLVRRSRCSKCGRPYMDCLCCKYLDAGVSQVIEEFPCLGAFWTNRRA
jgi:hypothetical protein